MTVLTSSKGFKLTIIGILVAVVAYVGYQRLIVEKDAVHIAVVNKTLKPNAESGILRGVQLYADQVNASGGINGKHLLIDVHNDGGSAESARQKVREIVDTDAVAVIGHRYSGISAAAGPVYQELGMPVVSAASTSPEVTEGNDWYFRTVFNNNQQGLFLAKYAKAVFNPAIVHVVHGSHKYGSTLAQVFARSSSKSGVNVGHQWLIDKESNPAEKVATVVAETLSTMDDPGIVLLALYPDEAVPVIKALRDKEVNVVILGVNSLARRDLPERFAGFTKERVAPGYYTNGIYVATPLIYDTANQQTGEFRKKYLKTYQSQPDWRAAFAYDAATVIGEAIRATSSDSEKVTSLKQDRQDIRDWLAELNSPQNAIRGVTGLNYFDKNGDPTKPVSVAEFQQGEMVSAPFQLVEAGGYIKDSQDIITIGEGRLHRTVIVYTGVTINEIDEVDMKKLTFTLSGEIWFRNAGQINPKDIRFINAVEPITLKKPIVSLVAPDGTQYNKYAFQGRFRADQLPGQTLYGEQLLGLGFRHKEQGRTRLIYVNDVLGMGLTGEKTLTDRQVADHILSKSSGWHIKNALISSEISGVSGQGNPLQFADTNGESDFSSYYYVATVAKSTMNIRRNLPADIAMVMLLLAAVLLLITPFLWRRAEKPDLLRKRLWMEMIIVLSAMLSIEPLLIEYINYNFEPNYILLAVRFFDICWWLVPALFIAMALDRFVWAPLEQSSGRPVPVLLRSFVNFLILLFAGFGIIAFVFDEKVTSLLASSGVIAMIIGLAVQINISNLFSGIAINLERPFRLGDWVKIGNHPEAKVVGITWRTTRMQTRDNEILNLPNTKTAESAILNFAMPNEVCRLIHKVRVHPRYTPEQMTDILTKACLAVDGVVSDPYPIIFYLGVTEWASEFNVAFFIDDFQRKPPLMTKVWHSIWNHLKEAGIAPAIMRQEIQIIGNKADGKELLQEG